MERYSLKCDDMKLEEGHAFVRKSFTEEDYDDFKESLDNYAPPLVVVGVGIAFLVLVIGFVFGSFSLNFVLSDPKGWTFPSASVIVLLIVAGWLVRRIGELEVRREIARAAAHFKSVAEVAGLKAQVAGHKAQVDAEAGDLKNAQLEVEKRMEELKQIEVAFQQALAQSKVVEERIERDLQACMNTAKESNALHEEYLRLKMEVAEHQALGIDLGDNGGASCRGEALGIDLGGNGGESCRDGDWELGDASRKSLAVEEPVRFEGSLFGDPERAREDQEEPERIRQNHEEPERTRQDQKRPMMEMERRNGDLNARSLLVEKELITAKARHGQLCEGVAKVHAELRFQSEPINSQDRHVMSFKERRRNFEAMRSLAEEGHQMLEAARAELKASRRETASAKAKLKIQRLHSQVLIEAFEQIQERILNADDGGALAGLPPMLRYTAYDFLKN